MFINTTTPKKPHITEPNDTKGDHIDKKMPTSKINKQATPSEKSNPTTAQSTKQAKPTSDNTKKPSKPTTSQSSSSLAHATQTSTQPKSTTTSDAESTPVMNYKVTASKAIKHNKYTHCFNLSVPGFQKQGHTRQNGLHSVLTGLAFQLNVVDHMAHILPWQSTYNTSHPVLGHGTASHTTQKQSNDYIRSWIRQGYM